MTSKEALEHIINVISDDSYYMDLLEEEFKILQKDLDVLEILRKYITELNKWAYFDEKTNKITTLKIISMIDLRPENNDYKTIKEWLENDK